jgi:hypothetical protein
MLILKKQMVCNENVQVYIIKSYKIVSLSYHENSINAASNTTDTRTFFGMFLRIRKNINHFSLIIMAPGGVDFLKTIMPKNNCATVPLSSFNKLAKKLNILCKTF